MKYTFAAAALSLAAAGAAAFGLTLLASPPREEAGLQAAPALESVLEPKGKAGGPGLSGTAAQPEEGAGQSGEPQYYLKGWQGLLAVFSAGEEEPMKIFDVYLATLPEYDRAQLEEGLPVADYEELLRRLEDFIS